MRQYEITYLVSDSVSESEITKVTGKIGGYVTDEGGKVLKEESWGRRKLAYPIAKQLFATYITMSFELEPDKLRAIERDIRHENDIIRHLIIVKKIGKEKMVLTAKDIADTKEIEEVVGGEKSFEAVEGMTDESFDLMSKRDETAPTLQQDVKDRSSDRSVGKESKDLMAVRGEDEDKNEIDIHKSPSQIDTDEEIKEPIKENIDAEKVEEIKEEPVEIVEKKPEAVVKSKKTEPAKKAATKKVVKKAEPKVEKPLEVSKLPEKSSTESAQKDIEDIAKKPVKKKAVKKDATASDEADRLAKLNQELDDILGEDL